MELQAEKKKVALALKRCDKKGIIVKSKPQLINLCGCNPSAFSEDANSKRAKFMVALVEMIDSKEIILTESGNYTLAL